MDFVSASAARCASESNGLEVQRADPTEKSSGVLPQRFIRRSTSDEKGDIRHALYVQRTCSSFYLLLNCCKTTDHACLYARLYASRYQIQVCTLGSIHSYLACPSDKCSANSSVAKLEHFTPLKGSIVSLSKHRRAALAHVTMTAKTYLTNLQKFLVRESENDPGARTSCCVSTPGYTRSRFLFLQISSHRLCAMLPHFAFSA
eukprot:1849680-Pleurochrysis_carterae.AAC.4